MQADYINYFSISGLKYYQIAFDTWAIVFAVIAAIAIYPARQIDPKASHPLIGMLLVDAVLNVAEVAAFSVAGKDGAYVPAIERGAMFAVYLCIVILLFLSARHVAAVISTRGGSVSREYMWIAALMFLVEAGLVVLSNVFDIFYTFDVQGLYKRLDGFWGFVVLVELNLALILVNVIRSKNELRPREFAGLVMFCLLPAAGAAGQYYANHLSVFNIADSMALIILVLVHQYEYTADVMEKERRRADEKIRLYQKQIQPHFIYNSLTAIRSYIYEPEKAEAALNHFTAFLRGSMDMLTMTECISAQREFDTVDSYLYMEKERFSDNLNIIWDVRDTGFVLPVFTVQFLVENAINHGIRKNPEGRGTLTVLSYESEGTHIIEVKDDGPGFDSLSAVDSEITGETGSKAGEADIERSHIGIRNVRERLSAMCGGSLEVESAVGTGTTARVIIPE